MTTPDLRADAIMEFFSYTHLPPALQEVSKPYYDMAWGLVDQVPRCAERTVALRKLLESKDCAVRASLSTKD